VKPATDSGTDARSRRGSPAPIVGAVGGRPRPRASAAGPSLCGVSAACGTPSPALTKRAPLPDVSGADQPSARTSLPARRGRWRSESMVSIGVTPPSGSFAKLQA
jgi:hypothetical protein